ncbi:MAG: septal ring lytic transglycosylase RlpA family protein, partial [Actinobacteria bacterium]|nr:septal ring lytic transglycosylase RlpA family protein [Actinomycetota bacterium]
PGGAVRRVARSGRGHQGPHQLPLVAPGGMMLRELFTRIRYYYDYSHAGSPTASGELYDPAAFTAAHKTMPFGTQLLVSHDGASVQVTVNDRGPYADGLDIDLSGAAADAIGLTSLGVAPVEVVVL